MGVGDNAHLLLYDIRRYYFVFGHKIEVFATIFFVCVDVALPLP